MTDVLRFLTDEMWLGLALVWSVTYLPISACLCVLALFLLWRRFRLRILDFSILFIPFLAWASLVVIDHDGKSWGNIFLEPGLIAALTPCHLVLRSRTSGLSPAVVVVLSVSGLSSIGLLAWMFIPELRLSG